MHTAIPLPSLLSKARRLKEAIRLLIAGKPLGLK